MLKTKLIAIRDFLRNREGTSQVVQIVVIIGLVALVALKVLPTLAQSMSDEDDGTEEKLESLTEVYE